MLGYQLSRMCRERGAVKHDDRIDALAQGVKWFTDALAISAERTIKNKKDQEFLDHLRSWIDDPQSEANHMVLGMNLDQRLEARGRTKGKSLPTWV